MTNLVLTLKKETEGLKNKYIEMTKKWAENHYRYLKSQNFDFLYLHTSGKYHIRGWAKTNAEEVARTRIANQLNKGEKNFISEAIESAQDHYNHSIEKLAFRIKDKGLDLNKLQIDNVELDVNLSITITDGKKTVKASTIWAEGEVNRPHFRYLIK